MKTKNKLLFLFLIIFVATASSQTKVQKLYGAKKYKKCLKLCDKNIKKNVEKYPSILYKSLTLIDASENEDILELYPSPIYEALKDIQRVGTHENRQEMCF